MHMSKPRHIRYCFHVVGVSILLSQWRPVFSKQMRIHLHVCAVQQMALNLHLCIRGQIAVVLCSLPSVLVYIDLFAISYATVHHRKLNLGPPAVAGSLYSKSFISSLGCYVKWN